MSRSTPPPVPVPDAEALRANASALAQIATALGLAPLSDAIRDETERRLGTSRLFALVLGEIKHGKSTLVNALVGPMDDGEVLPTGVTPTTAVAVHVTAGAPSGRFVVHPDRGREAVGREQFFSLIRGGALAPGTHLLAVCGEDRLPAGLELVDTPGSNDLDRMRQWVARGELPRADVLILVLDATQMLSRTELGALRAALDAVGGLTGSGAHLCVVVNRADLVAEDERPTLQAYLQPRLVELGAGDEASLFFTDARTALRAFEPGARPIEPGPAAEVGRLREHLIEIAASRMRRLPLRAQTGLRHRARLLRHHVALATRAIELEATALRHEIAAVEQALADRAIDRTAIHELVESQRAHIVADSRARLDLFRADLRESAIATIRNASLRALSHHVPGSLHDAFVGFSRAEGERLQTALETLTRTVLHTHDERARRRLGLATLRLYLRGPALELEPPGIALEAASVALAVVGTAVMYFGSLMTGMIMTVTGPLATVILREKSLRDARERARLMVPVAIEQASEHVAAAIATIVNDHAAALREHVDLADAELHSQLLAVLHNAQARLLGPEDEAEQTRQKARDELARLAGELDRIERSLA